MWRLADGKQFTTLPESEGAGLLVTSADGAWLAAHNKVEDAIYVWPLEHIADRITIREVGITSVLLNPDALQISADGARIAAFNADSASVWNSADGALLLSVSLEDIEIEIDHIGLAANGQRLAVGYDDGVVEVWSVENGEIVQLFEHGQSLNGIALSPDGTRLAVGHSGDSVVTIITASERALAQSRSRRGLSTGGQQFLTPGQVYIDTIPGYGMVWEIAP